MAVISAQRTGDNVYRVTEPPDMVRLLQGQMQPVDSSGATRWWEATTETHPHRLTIGTYDVACRVAFFTAKGWSGRTDQVVTLTTGARMTCLMVWLYLKEIWRRPELYESLRRALTTDYVPGREVNLEGGPSMRATFTDPRGVVHDELVEVLRAYLHPAGARGDFGMPHNPLAQKQG